MLSQILPKIRKYCAYQDRSVQEVKTKLRTLGTLASDYEKIINTLSEENFLDDERFAQNFVRSKLQTKGWGVQKIKFALYQKGISNNIIQSVLPEINADEYEKQLLNNIEKWKRTHEFCDATKPNLVRYLAAKGFNYSEIMKYI